MCQIDDIFVVADMVAQTQQKLENTSIRHTDIETFSTGLIVDRTALLLSLCFLEVDLDRDC
jgi:hypothetical protein